MLEYLEEMDPELAVEARQRYSCLEPFEANPAGYGRAALNPRFEGCEHQVLEILGELSARQRRYAEHDRVRFLDAVQNARPSLQGSFERLCHITGIPAFLLPLARLRACRIRTPSDCESRTQKRPL